MFPVQDNSYSILSSENILNGVYSGFGININNQIAGIFLKNAGFYTGQSAAGAALRILLDENETKVDNVSAGLEMIEENQGYLVQIQDKVNDMKDLATQAAAGGLTGPELADLQDQFTTLRLEVDQLAQGNIRKTSLLKSNGQESVVAGTILTVAIDKRDMTSNGLGLFNVDLTTDAQTGLEVINDALDDIENFQVHLDTKYDTLDAASSALEIQRTTYLAAQSAVESTNAALMMVGMLNNMSGSHMSMFLAAQANLTTETVLNLLSDE